MRLDFANQTLLLDGSSLSAWDECPQRYWFTHVAGDSGYVPDIDAPFFTAGGALHAALAIRRCECNTEGVPPDCMARMEAAIHDTFAKASITPDWRSPAEVTRLLRAYLKEYPRETFVAVECERAFSHCLGKVQVNGEEWTVNWAGKRDAVVRFSGDGDWIVDTKTASRKDWPPKKFGQSRAMLGYCWAWQQQTGKLPAGFIMDLCYWREPTSKTPEPPFEFDRPAFPIQEWQLQEWRAGVLLDAHHIIESAQLDVWPKAGASGHPNPCLGCRYHEPCTVAPDFRLGTVRAMQYRKNNWSPLNES